MTGIVAPGEVADRPGSRANFVVRNPRRPDVRLPNPRPGNGLRNRIGFPDAARNVVLQWQSTHPPGAEIARPGSPEGSEPVDDPLIARFAAACGAAGPLALSVGLADGTPLAEGEVAQPFALVGRDDSCDVTLTDPAVDPRHAWLQVLGGQVYAVDLNSRTGLRWPAAPPGSGWLVPGTTAEIGPFRLRVRGPAAPAPADEPTVPDPDFPVTHPAVHLEFRNGRRAADRWAVDRPLTLVGRSDGCKLKLVGDDIAPYHCGLVHTPAGLWVVDLSGRGVVVGGERMRVAPLPAGAELWVGRFLIGCHAGPPRSGRVAAPAPPARTADDFGPPTAVVAVRPAVPEDEVALGGPLPEPEPGLPASHILSDVAAQAPGDPADTPAPAATPPPAGRLAPLLRRLGEAQARMFDDFQQALRVTVQLYGRVPAGPAAAAREELTRLRDLTAELVRVQGEVAEWGFADPAGPTDATPLPGHPPLPAGPRLPDPAEAIRAWVEERVGVLVKERDARWERLVGLVAAADDTGPGERGA